MIKFSTIQSIEDRYWPLFTETYLTSFPIEEQRPIRSIERLITEEKRYNAAAVLDENDTYIGLLTSWEFDAFTYIEHFAIKPGLRSSGYGTKALHAFMQTKASPIILEAEPPTDNMAKRRIRFYERNGFTLYDYDYYQPPYSSDRQGVALKLMGSIAENKDFSTSVAHTLHREVYNMKN